MWPYGAMGPYGTMGPGPSRSQAGARPGPSQGQAKPSQAKPSQAKPSSLYQDETPDLGLGFQCQISSDTRHIQGQILFISSSPKFICPVRGQTNSSHKFGTQIWIPNLGTQIWIPNLDTKFRSQLWLPTFWDPNVGTKFGYQIWILTLVSRFGTQIWAQIWNCLDRQLPPQKSPGVDYRLPDGWV